MAYTSRVDKKAPLTQTEADNNFLCHYPIGAIYMNANNSNSPNTYIGYGTWKKFAEGRALIGREGAIGSANGSPSGSPSVQLSVDQIPPHGHGDNSWDTVVRQYMIYYDESKNISSIGADVYRDGDGNYRYAVGDYSGTLVRYLRDYSDAIGAGDGQYTYFEADSDFVGDLNPNRSNESLKTDYYGFSNYHDNIQPYIVVYMWERTA